VDKDTVKHSSPSVDQSLKPLFAQGLAQPQRAMMAPNAQNREQAHLRTSHQDTAEFVELEHQLDAATTVVIPEGVTIKGAIETNGKAAVFVKGEVLGNIIAGDKEVYVACGARVAGQIQSESDVFIAGVVQAENSNSNAIACVKTPQRFVLAATGRIEGDVEYGSIRIYGGVVAGRMLPNEKAVR
jgi:hypothetical protein